MLVVTPFNSTSHFLLVHISHWVVEGSTEVGRKGNPSDLLSTPSMGLLSVALVWPGLWGHGVRDQLCVAGRQGVDHAWIICLAHQLINAHMTPC